MSPTKDLPMKKRKTKARIDRKDNKKMKGLWKNKRVKVLDVMQAAVSPESSFNPGLLCLFCVCLCVGNEICGDGHTICVSVTFVLYTGSAAF